MSAVSGFVLNDAGRRDANAVRIGYTAENPDS